MRLICPNCDAEYAVDDAAIPAQGRDVQCSNCGHGWFQMHPEAEAEAEAEAALFDPPAADAAPADAPSAPEMAPGIAAETAPATPEAIPRTEEEDGEPAPTPPVAAGAQRTLDDNLLAILREEAAREAAVRKAEGARGVESQPDLGLTEPTRIAPAPVADTDTTVLAPTGASLPDTAHAGVTADRPAPRRDLLPDIEEINSTLRAGADPRGGDGDVPAEVLAATRRSGFRSGFFGVLVVAGVLLAGYAMAPQIARHLPGAAPAMTRYVAAVDSARQWLDGVMQRAAGALRGLGGGPG